MKRTTLCILLALFLPTTVTAEVGFKIMTSNELYEKMNSKEKILIIDSRPGEEYREGHIPTSINIPPGNYENIERFLTRDKETTLIFYCRGIG
jgi:rhodanese-related sulfurtransferase